MEGLINDMLDQAKINNGVFSLNEEYFDLPMVVFKALNIVKGQANSKQVQLSAEVEVSEHMNLLNNIWGDKQRYLQIFNNFLSNSVKFTPNHGKVRIHIRITDH